MITEIQTVFSESIVRASDEGDGRTIEGMVVPWNKPAPVIKPTRGYELYKRGAFDKSLNEAGRVIPLLLHHAEDEPAAKMVAHESRADGQYMVFRALNTRAGNDAIELVREGVITGLSIGGFAIPARTKITRLKSGENLIERQEIKLDHVGLVRIPAFENAQVMALRSLDLTEYDPVAAAKARKRIRQRLREAS